MPGLQNFTDPSYLAKMNQGKDNWILDNLLINLANTDELEVTGIPNARNQFFIVHGVEAGGNLTGINLTMNDISTADYAFRRTVNGAAETTSTSATNFIETGTTDNDILLAGWLTQVGTRPKLLYCLEADAQGLDATTAPRRSNIYGKADLTATLTSLQAINASTPAAGFGIFSIFAQTTFGVPTVDDRFFWNSSGQANLEADATSLDASFSSSSIAWIMFQTRSAGSHSLNMRFNGDSAANYSMRYRVNAGSETTLTSQTQFEFYSGNTGDDVYGSLFMVAISGRPAILTGQLSLTNSNLASAAPDIVEFAGKYTGTSPNTVNLLDSVNMLVGSKIRVWTV